MTLLAERPSTTAAKKETSPRRLPVLLACIEGALIIAVLAFPWCAANLLVWPSPLAALLPAFGWSLAAFAPMGALNFAVETSGRRLFGAFFGVLIGAFVAVHGASAILLASAIFSLREPPVAVGGEIVSLECHSGTCSVGVFDHARNAHTRFRVPASTPGLSIGSPYHQCLRPAWPSSARFRFQNAQEGCAPLPTEASKIAQTALSKPVAPRQPPPQTP